MSVPPLVPASPYKGLTPFGDSDLDALLFFGRERDAGIVAANLIAARLTVLYGPSGVGKSSMLRASVARGLRSLPERPLVVVFSSWGDDPLGALVAAVSEAAGVPPGESLVETVQRACEAHGDVYLILDQAEEYFLYHPGDGGFEPEFALLVTEPLRVNVLLSLREDALAQLDRFKARIPNILGNYLRLDRLDRAAGHDAIVRPVERYNALGDSTVAVEPALVDEVLDQVTVGRIGYGLGGLGGVETNGQAAGIEAPFLQLVMQRIWEVERGAGSEALRAETLAALGGAGTVVADHLERAMEALVPRQREIAALLFNHLVTPSGTKIAHGVADLAEYANVPEAEVRPVVASLAEHRILRPDEAGRYEIFHDVLAGAVLAWRTRYDAERAVERARVEARRRNRRLGFLAFGALVAVATMAALTVYAFQQRDEAQAQAQEATARELVAASGQQLPVEPELGLLLAAEAAELAPASPVVETGLRTALQHSDVRASWPLEASASVVASGRRTLVAGTADGHVAITRAEPGATVVRRSQGSRVSSVAVSRDGEHVATGGRDGTVRLWSVDGSPEAVLRHRGPVVGVAFSPDARTVATASEDRTVRVWDRRAGRLLRTLRHGAPVDGLAFGLNGSRLLTWSGREARLYAVRRGRLLHRLEHPTQVEDAELSRDGALLATAGQDGAARLWSTASGKLRRPPLGGHGGRVTAVAFSPDGTQLATASTDNAGRVWDVFTGSAVAVLSGHENYVSDIAYSPDGRWLLTTGRDSAARVWDTAGIARSLLAGHRQAIVGARFTANGSRVVTAGEDGTMRLWDPGTEPQLAPTNRPSDANRVRPPPRTATSPDGRTVATVSGDIVVLRPAGGGKERRLAGHRDVVNSVAFSPDSRLLLTASRDHDVRVWDVATGAQEQVLAKHSGLVADARFSPDGRWVLTAGPVTVGLWRVDGWSFVDYLRGPHPTLVAAAFAPDSRTVLTREKNGTVRRWSCTICGGVDELLREARSQLSGTGRALTDAERRQFLR